MMKKKTEVLEDKEEKIGLMVKMATKEKDLIIQGKKMFLGIGMM
jgi:hypothetical protein